MSAATSPPPAPDDSLWAPPPDPFALAADIFDPPEPEPAPDQHVVIDGVRITPWMPTRRPGSPDTPTGLHPPQVRFLQLDCFEAFYGGAAGGGKSDALLMAALQYVDVPGYAALLLRKTFADLELPGALMDRAMEWLAGTDARWNGNRHRWTFPSGATLTFGYLDTEKHKFRYQGAEFNFVGFDELTQFDEADYTYLASRIRHPEEGPLSLVPDRLRSAANPGGRGHRWVKRRLIDRKPNPDDPEDTPEKCAAREFVPARLADNPSVDQDAYKAALSTLDPQTRAQLLSGDWNAREPGDWVFPIGLDEVFELGQRFDAADRPTPPVGSALVLGADWGVHAHVLVLWPTEAGGVHVAREVVNDVASIRTVAPRVADEVKPLGWPVYSERFDASMPGLNDAFLEKLTPLLPWRIRWIAVPFNKYKALTIDYLKLLVTNAHLRVRYPKGVGLADLPEHDLRRLARSVGQQHEPEEATVAEIVDALAMRAVYGPVLSISEQHAPVLAEQIRLWRWRDADVGRTEKGDDHGPDALVAGLAPEAARRAPARR